MFENCAGMPPMMEMKRTRKEHVEQELAMLCLPFLGDHCV